MRPKTYVLVVLSLALTSLAWAGSNASVIGTWKGSLVREGASLPVSFSFSQTAEGLVATFSSPTQRALEIPLRKVTAEAGSVHFELVGDATTTTFDGKVSGERMTGRFTEGAAAGEFSLEKIAPEAPPFRVEDVQFSNGQVSLAGSLLVPNKKGPYTAVIFLHGSGSEGRFGSRFLADRFARAGIAALIYDKRGVGKSTGNWRQATFADLVSDALAGVNWLKARGDIRKIGVYGHSQGGMLAPFLASRSSDIRFVVSGAGGALPLYEGEVHSIATQLRQKGVPESEMAAATAYIVKFVDALRVGELTPEFAAETERVKNTSWFPHVHVPPADNWAWKHYAGIANYDSTQYWRTVTVPVLLMYGERDIYVPIQTSIANIDRALRTAGNEDYSIIVFPRASHSFNVDPQRGAPFEWSRVAPGFPEIVVAWVRERGGS